MTLHVNDDKKSMKTSYALDVEIEWCTSFFV